jgi:hypothetical protein
MGYLMQRVIAIADCKNKQRPDPKKSNDTYYAQLVNLDQSTADSDSA